MALPAPPVVRNDVTCDSLRPWALERKVGPEGKLGGGAREPPPMQLPWPFVEVLLPQAHGGEAVQVHLGRLQLCRGEEADPEHPLPQAHGGVRYCPRYLILAVRWQIS